MMREYDHGDIVLEEDDGIYEKGDTLKSSSGSSSDSRKVLLAGFLSVWLKR